METTVKTPPTETSAEPIRPRIVRNREVDKEASVLAQDHILPIPPGNSLDWDQVEKYLALLTPAMWSHLMVYVYRIKPKIRRQLRDPNSPNYIDCLSEPFTKDYLISRHGGGKYQLCAVDTDSKRGTKDNQLFKCLLDINDVQHPPILNYDELEIEARENKSYVTWLQNKGILDANGKVMTPQPAVPPSAATNLSAKEVLDILGYAAKMNADQQSAFRSQFAPGPDSLSKSVGDILLEKMRQDDPREDWKMMMGFMEKVNKPDGTLGQMLQMQQEQRKTDLEYIKLILANQMTQASPKSQFGEFREFLMFAREIWQTGGGGGRRTGWDTGLEIARDVVLPGLQTLGATITNIMSLKNGGAPVAGGPGGPGHTGPPQAFDPYSNPAARAAYASTLNQQPQPQPAPAPAPPPPAPGPSPQPGAPGQPADNDAQNQLIGLFQQYGNLIVGHLNSGTPGYDFAGMIVDLVGTATHAMIATQGEELLAVTMMKIPEMAIFGEQRLRQFIHEFIHYQEYFDQQQTDEEPELEPEIEMPKIYRPAPRSAKAPHVETRA